MVRPTFFHSAATCLHVPTRLTRESTKHEGRKPRANERHVVGCCEEFGRPCHLGCSVGRSGVSSVPRSATLAPSASCGELAAVDDAAFRPALIGGFDSRRLSIDTSPALNSLRMASAVMTLSMRRVNADSTRREINSIDRFTAGVGFYSRSTELSVITFG